MRLHRRVAIHLGDIGAGDERLLTGTSQYHHPYGIVLCSPCEGEGQLVECVAVQRVELVRTVDRNGANRAAVAGFQVAIGHEWFPMDARTRW